MATRIAINGFGRIGRLVFRALYTQGRFGKDFDVVAVGDIVPADNLAYLLKYDSVQGKFEGQVGSKKSAADKADDDVLLVDGKEIRVVSAKSPAELPWKDLGRRHRDRVHRPVRRQGEGRGPHQGGRQEGHHLRSGQERGHHHRLRGQPREVRPRPAQGDLQRQLHHQLSGAGGARAAQGGLRAQRGPDDHRARLHRHPEDGRRPLQEGLEGRSLGGHQHHPFDHRRRQGGRSGAARGEGQADRHVVARAGADRVGGRSRPSRPPRRPASRRSTRR